MRRHHHLRRLMIAVATLTVCGLFALAPADAQSDVTAANVTRVQVPTGLFDKTGPASWLETGTDGKTFNFVEDSRDGSSIYLSDASRGVKLQLDLNRKQVFYSDATQALRPLYTVTDVSADTCKQSDTTMNCNCDLRWLRPLQGAIGMGEVINKANKIVAKPDKAEKRLSKDPIKTVRGPRGGLFEGDLYVTDHHHGARAWLEAGHTIGICRIQEILSAEPAQFWAQAQNRSPQLVHLEDKDGRVITPEALPKTVKQLPDDPYRTLAWMVRKQDGFCRALMKGHTDFAEFRWADWMRGRTELPASQVADSPAAMLPAALALAKSPIADATLPGYRGNQPASYTCPDDDDDD